MIKITDSQIDIVGILVLNSDDIIIDNNEINLGRLVIHGKASITNNRFKHAIHISHDEASDATIIRKL